MPRLPLKFQKPTKKQSQIDIPFTFSEMAELQLELALLKKKYQEALNQIDSIVDLEDLKKEFAAKLQELNKKFEQKVSEITDAAYEIMQRAKAIQKGDKGDPGQEGKPGKDGYTPIKGKDYVDGYTPQKGIDYFDGEDAKEIVNLVLNDIPPPKELEPKEIAKKINTLEGIIDMKVIKNLEAQLRNIQSKTMMGKSGGGGSWHRANLSGTIDGSNRTFTWSGVKAAEYSERVMLNYIEQGIIGSTDYTINYETNTITYTVAPDASLSGLPHTIRYHA